MAAFLGKVRRRLTRLLFPQRYRPSQPLAPPAAQPAPKHPDWPELLGQDWGRWQAAVKAAEDGPPVLIATSVGAYLPGTVFESLLAVALTLRGARVHILLCDAALPACMNAMVQMLPADEFAGRGLEQRLCPSCFAPAYAMYQSLGLPVHRYGDFMTAEERRAARSLSATVPFAEIGCYQWEGVAVGEHALAGALRYYARGDLESEPQAEAILRRFFNASLLTTGVIRRLLNTRPWTGACFHHGIYVPQGLIAEVARQTGVRVVNWAPAYRKKRFIVTHRETYHHALMSEPTANWETIRLTDRQEAELTDYLKSRWYGTRDWIWFHEKPEEELPVIAGRLGIDFSRPCIGMLTNVMWDAQLHYRANAFPNMLDWAVRTIRYFAARPDLQLVIRIHPAEIRGTIESRQPLLAEIQKAFPELPRNVFVIPPESPISTYVVAQQCNAVLVYGTKTGVELTSMGIPVIVAGEAWIRNKGLTLDAVSPEQYFAWLDQLPSAGWLDEATLRRARTYAYHFFFRRMIPLEMLEPSSGWPPYRIRLSALDDLGLGRSPGLDLICDGILTGAEFVYPAESLPDTLE